MNKREAKKREKQIRAKALFESGYSIEEIAKALGVSEKTVKWLIKEEENANS